MTVTQRAQPDSALEEVDKFGVAIATDPLYGSDAHGMVCGFLFQPGAPVVPVDDAQRVLRGSRPADGAFAWLHFNLSHAATEPWLRAHAGLDDDFFDGLHSGSRSTRIEREADSLFAVINDVVFNFAFEASDVATLWVSVRPWLVLTARRSPLRAIDRLRTEVKQGHTLESPLALVEHLFRHQADELQRIARAATDRVDDIEDEVLAGHLMTHSAELARLRRMSVRLQRLLVPEPSAMLRLLANPPSWVPPRDVQRLQQAYDEFAVVLRDIGSLQERIKLLQDESSARVAEENNRSLFVLTMVTVLALPINLTSGLMGMNVGGVPLGQDPHGFWWMFLLIGAITVAMAWLAVRWWRKSKRRP